MIRDIKTLEELKAFIASHRATLIYFASQDCGVCDAIEPKLLGLLGELFPHLVVGRVDCTKAPAIAAQYSIFSVPTVVVYVEGRETFRRARNFSVSEVRRELARPYDLLFG